MSTPKGTAQEIKEELLWVAGQAQPVGPDGASKSRGAGGPEGEAA